MPSSVTLCNVHQKKFNGGFIDEVSYSVETGLSPQLAHNDQYVPSTLDPPAYVWPIIKSSQTALKVEALMSFLCERMLVKLNLFVLATG